jgi:hypothetical protein
MKVAKGKVNLYLTCICFGIIYIDNKVWCVNVALIFHNMFSNYLHDSFEAYSSTVQWALIP